MRSSDRLPLARLVMERHFPDDLDDFASEWPPAHARKSSITPTLGMSESGLGSSFAPAAWIACLSEISEWIETEGHSLTNAARDSLAARLAHALRRAPDAPTDISGLSASIVSTVVDVIREVH
jgi:hypothetical protein